jgi:hypothetical protein
MRINYILRQILVFLDSSHFVMMMIAFAFSAIWRRYDWYDVIIDTALLTILVKHIAVWIKELRKMPPPFTNFEQDEAFDDIMKEVHKS